MRVEPEPWCPRGHPLSARIVGPGALGCALAGALLEAGLRVTLQARSEAAAAELRERGLRLEEGEAARAWTTGVAAGVAVGAAGLVVAAPGEAGVEDDLVIVCVKARDTSAALAAVPAGEAPVLIMQNGLAGFETSRREAGGRALYGALTRQAASRLSPGRVVRRGRGATEVAPLSAAARLEDARAIAAALSAWGWPAEACADLGPALWGKLAINAAINALTGLLGVPNGALLNSPAALELGDAAAREAFEVARALGIRPRGEAEAWRAVAAATAANRSSTLQDLSAGRPTEVEAINGAIAELGEQLGIAAPVNAMLARLTRASEECRKAREVSLAHPGLGA